MNAPAGKKPFNARCRDCDHVFVVCWLPMPLEDAAKTMRAAHCPNCAGKKLAIDQSSNSQPEEQQ